MLGLSNKSYILDERKNNLENYLKSTLEAIVHSRNQLLLEYAAEFLDDEFEKLRFS